MPRAKSAAALALTSAPGASMKIVTFSVFLIRDAALPPAFSQSWTVRSAGLPRPSTTIRSTGAPSGATRSRAASDFAEKRAIFDALAITPAGSAISAPAAVSASDVFRRIARPPPSFADFENEISNFADMSSPMGFMKSVPGDNIAFDGSVNGRRQLLCSARPPGQKVFVIFVDVCVDSFFEKSMAGSGNPPAENGIRGLYPAFLGLVAAIGPVPRLSRDRYLFFPAFFRAGGV